MDIAVIGNLLSESGIHVCPICGTPFDPYHSRQKTCGTEECKRIFHNRYVQDRARRLKAEDPKAFNIYHANAQRKYRAKQRKLNLRDSELVEVNERWEREAEFQRKISEYGHEYGKRSAEKILATIPKIDVNLGGKHDTVHTKDNTE